MCLMFSQIIQLVGLRCQSQATAQPLQHQKMDGSNLSVSLPLERQVLITGQNPLVENGMLLGVAEVAELAVLLSAFSHCIKEKQSVYPSPEMLLFLTMVKLQQQQAVVLVVMVLRVEVWDCMALEVQVVMVDQHLEETQQISQVPEAALEDQEKVNLKVKH